MTIDRISIGSRRSDAANGFFVSGLRISRRLSERSSELTMTVVPKARDGNWVPAPLETITVYSGNEPVFGGYVRTVELERHGLADVDYILTADDWSIKLNSAQVTEGTSWQDQSDQRIIRDVAAAHSAELGGLDVSTDLTSVVSLAVPKFATQDETFADTLRRLSEVSGAEYYVDPSRQLRWFSPVHHLAPVSLSDRPNESINLLGAPEALDDSSWTKNNVTVEANVQRRPAVVPRGVADILRETAANGEHGISQYFTLERGKDYVFSAYVAPTRTSGGRTTVTIGGGGREAEFDLAATTASAAILSGSSAIWQNPSEPPPAEQWRRVGVRFRAISTVAHLKVMIGTSDYAGDTSEGLAVTALQLVEGTALPPYRSGGTGQFYAVRSWAIDGSEIANRITVIGEDDVRETVNDTASQRRHGIWHRTVTDRTIEDDGTAQLRGAVELKRHSKPLIEATIHTEVDGIEPGMSLVISNHARGYVWEEVTVRSVLQEQGNAHGESHYTIDLGPPVRDLNRLVQLLAWRQRTGGTVPEISGLLSESSFPIYARGDTQPADTGAGTVDDDGEYSPPSGWSLSDPGGSEPLWTRFVTRTED